METGNHSRTRGETKAGEVGTREMRLREEREMMKVNECHGENTTRDESANLPAPSSSESGNWHFTETITRSGFVMMMGYSREPPPR